jgi:hypothetical protein
MSSSMIEPVPAPRIETLVTDALTGVERRRTDYAGTVWYGGRPQVMSGMTVTMSSSAQISSPFWLPDSHVYTSADAHLQASAGIQSLSGEPSQIVEVGAGLGEDGQAGGLRVWLAVSAVARIPLAVSYRVTVLCSPDAVGA